MKLITTVANAWHDEMKMLGLAIWILMPIAVLISLNMGLFFMAMDLYAAAIIIVASIGFLCMARAMLLRLKKII